MVDNEFGKIGNMACFTSMKRLIMPLKCNFFRASFLHFLKDTDSMSGHAAQIFLK